jgi:hypothetical protein
LLLFDVFEEEDDSATAEPAGENDATIEKFAQARPALPNEDIKLMSNESHGPIRAGDMMITVGAIGLRAVWTMTDEMKGSIDLQDEQLLTIQFAFISFEIRVMLAPTFMRLFPTGKMFNCVLSTHMQFD